MNQTYNLAGGDVCLFHADCREALRALPDNCIDSVCCDPPYHLTSVVKRFGSPTSAPAQHGKDGAFARQSRGFLGQSWDGGDIAFRPETWAEVLRVCKPGAYLASFGSTRGYHRMACAIEDAGFEIRDSLMWVYGTGWNKKGYIRDSAGEIVSEGFAGALKPAFEPIVLARKPLSESTVALNMARWGTGALNIDACRIGTSDNLNGGTYAKHTEIDGVSGSLSGPLKNAIGKEFVQPEGRWPANIIHSGEDCIVEAFPQSAGQLADVSYTAPSLKTKNVYGKMNREGEASAKRRYAEQGSTNFAALPGQRRSDQGSAARFFACCPYDESEQEFRYSAKANKTDRAGSKHATIKPVRLLKWLTNLLTPKGGITLDPFAGSGTTAQAALQNGFKAILCEREAEYVADIIRRLSPGSPPLVPSQAAGT